MMRRILITILVCACITRILPAEKDDFSEIIPSQIKSIEKGLEYLARKQNRDGSWDSGSQYRMHPGITALACLAFMAGGNLPDEGKYSENVRRGLNFILKCVTKDGLIISTPVSNPMYGHGYATLFLAEVYGMTGDRDLKPYLRKAVNLILNSQKNDDGWRYSPDKRGDSDISVTVIQLMALRAARNAGIDIPASVIERGIGYIEKSRCEDGGFAYTLTHKRSGFARTAAGVMSLYLAGKYQAGGIDEGLKYLDEYRADDAREKGRMVHWFYYGHYYAAQAMFQAGGSYWRNWFSWIRAELLRRQTSEGAWSDDSRAGPVFATSMALMILEIPYRYLPIFQR